MLRKISLRLPDDIYEGLGEEAKRDRISISDVIRERIFSPQGLENISNGEASKNLNFEKTLQELAPQISQNKEKGEENYLILLEILFLLRSFLLERNSQILKKIDDKLDQRFGKGRKKIL